FPLCCAPPHSAAKFVSTTAPARDLSSTSNRLFVESAVLGLGKLVMESRCPPFSRMYPAVARIPGPVLLTRVPTIEMPFQWGPLRHSTLSRLPPSICFQLTGSILISAAAASAIDCQPMP